MCLSPMYICIVIESNGTERVKNEEVNYQQIDFSKNFHMASNR